MAITKVTATTVVAPPKSGDLYLLDRKSGCQWRDRGHLLGCASALSISVSSIFGDWRKRRVGLKATAA